MNDNEQIQLQFDLYNDYVRFILPSFTTFANPPQTNTVMTEGNILVVDIDSMIPRLLDSQLLSSTISDGQHVNVSFGTSPNVSPRSLSPTQRKSLESYFPITPQKQFENNNYGYMTPSRNAGYRHYARNEFRSLHTTRKSNTSRPPSLHVDEFKAREEAVVQQQQQQQYQIHPLTGLGITGGMVATVAEFERGVWSNSSDAMQPLSSFAAQQYPYDVL